MDTESEYGQVTPAMVEHLRDTRLWVLMIGIMGFVVSALMVVASLAVVVLGTFSNDFGVVWGFLLGLIYLFLSAIYVVMSFYLFKYGTAIGTLVKAKSTHAMEDALGYQKSFWRVVGIVVMVYMVLTVLGLAVAVFFGLFAAPTP